MKYHYFLFLTLVALSTPNAHAVVPEKHIDEITSWLNAEELNVQVFHCENVGAEVEVTEIKTHRAEKEAPLVNIFYCDQTILNDTDFFENFVKDEIALNIFFVCNWQPDPKASHLQQTTEWKTFCAQFVSPDNNRIICKLTTEDFTKKEQTTILGRLPKRTMAVAEEESSSPSSTTPKASKKRRRRRAKPPLAAVIPDVELVEPLNHKRITTHGKKLVRWLTKNQYRFIIYHCYDSTLEPIAQNTNRADKYISIFYCDPASLKNDCFLAKSLCSEADLNVIFAHGWRNEYADLSDEEAQDLFDRRIETVEEMDLKPCVLGLPDNTLTEEHTKEILENMRLRNKKAAQPVAQLPAATVAAGAAGAGHGGMADSEDDDSESAAVPTDRIAQEKFFFKRLEKEYKKRILENECKLMRDYPHLERKQLKALSRKSFFEFFETPATVTDQANKHTYTTSLHVDGLDKFFAVSSSFLHGKEFNDPTVKYSFLISSGRMRNVFRSSENRVKDNAYFIFFESKTRETNDELEKMEVFFNDTFYEKYEYQGAGKFAPIIYRIKPETRLNTPAAIQKEVTIFLNLFFATLESNKKKLLKPTKKPSRKKIKRGSDADATEGEDSDATEGDEDEHEDSDAAVQILTEKKEPKTLQEFFSENLKTEFSGNLKKITALPQNAQYLETNRRVCFDFIKSLTELEHYGKTRPKNTFTPKGLDALIVVSSDMFNTPGCSVKAASEIFKPKTRSKKLDTTFTPSDYVLDKNIVIILVKNGTDDPHSEKIDDLAEFLKNAENPPLVCVANAQKAKDSKKISTEIITKLANAVIKHQELVRTAQIAQARHQLMLAREEQERLDARAAEEVQRKEAAEKQAAEDARLASRERFIAARSSSLPFARKIFLFDESKNFLFFEKTQKLEQELRKQLTTRDFRSIRYFDFTSVVSYFKACLDDPKKGTDFAEWERTSGIGMIALVGTEEEIAAASGSAAYKELLNHITKDRIIRYNNNAVLEKDLELLKNRFETEAARQAQLAKEALERAKAQAAEVARLKKVAEEAQLKEEAEKKAAEDAQRQQHGKVNLVSDDFYDLEWLS